MTVIVIGVMISMDLDGEGGEKGKEEGWIGMVEVRRGDEKSRGEREARDKEGAEEVCEVAGGSSDDARLGADGVPEAMGKDGQDRCRRAERRERGKGLGRGSDERR